MLYTSNVAYSRATDLTILACPLNMQGMPGALQVLAALLHGVQTIYAHDNKAPTVRGSLDPAARVQPGQLAPLRTACSLQAKGADATGSA